MKKKISASKEKKEDSAKEETQDIQELQSQNLALRDLVNLRDEAYFRQQVLALLERIAKAEEKRNELMLDEESEEDDED